MDDATSQKSHYKLMTDEMQLIGLKKIGRLGRSRECVIAVFTRLIAE